MKDSIETYHLHAYLDGELSQKESSELESVLKTNKQINKKLQELKQLKAKLSTAYTHQIPKPPVNKSKESVFVDKTIWSLPKAIAASLFLGLLIGAGALKAYEFSQPYPQMMQLSSVAKSDNFLVHIDSDLPGKQKLAIKEIESLLENSPEKVKVDLISNSRGIDLLDVNNPNSKELNKLLNKYDNLTLYACKRALARARARGKVINLLPSVKHDKPAIDAVVERLNSGWKYIKI